MKKPIHTLLAFLLIAVTPLLTSCDDDDDTVAQADVIVEFNNTVNGQEIVLGKTYTSPAADTYAVEDFKYFISNVKLMDANGTTVFTELNSYHLINQTAGKTSFELKNVPAGSYSQITFSLGVDEAHNHSTDQEGDLDPSSDMVWDWDTGYKFMLLEGTYTGNTKSGGLIFHIGEDANYTTFNMPLQVPLDIRTKPDYTLRITTDLNALFQNPHTVDFDELNTAMGGANARKIADNYSKGFFSLAELR